MKKLKFVNFNTGVLFFFLITREQHFCDCTEQQSKVVLYSVDVNRRKANSHRNYSRQLKMPYELMGISHS